MADAPTQQQTILIVDDEASYRMMLRGLLQKKGFRVIEAENGEAGIEAAKREIPDLILMDVNMPRLKGSEAVRILKETPEAKHIPILVISGREDSDDLLKSFEYGASDYVRKVFHHEEMLARINAHLSISQLRGKLLATNERLRAANERLRSDLHYAGEIQRSILASVLPRVDGMDFASRYVPCEDTSGDHYSAFWLGDDRIGICIADASGHGVGAAMLAVFLKGHLENICRAGDTPRDPLRDPAEVMELINRSLCDKRFGREFISAIYGILTPSKREFRFCNAGHPYPMLLGADGSVREIETRNTVLGIFPDSEYNTDTLRLESGQGLLLYTDGLVEARNAGREEFGVEKLQHALAMSLGLGAEAVADRIIRAAESFRDGYKAEDDLTLLYFAQR